MCESKRVNRSVANKIEAWYFASHMNMNGAIEFYQEGSFLCLDGPAKKAGLSHSNMKVCLTCRDPEFLKNLIAKVAQDEECYWVKMSTKSRDGMYLGRCFRESVESWDGIALEDQ